MRSTCTVLAAIVVAAPLFVLVPGCDSGTAELEAPPAPKKVDPVTDMPGFKNMQDQMKTKGKAR
jgi:hypothetical protein